MELFKNVREITKGNRLKQADRTSANLRIEHNNLL
jgi:hypothetical protein